MNAFLTDRAVALLLYGIVRKYSHDDLWYKMVRTKLQLQQHDIARISCNYQNNGQEKKFKMLDFWRKSKNLGKIMQKCRCLAS